MESKVSAKDKYDRKSIQILDTKIAYIDEGKGDPVVFLHGNPTSSYLWRNVIPEVENIARCLAPDLVGMGQSGNNPSGSYRFVDHARYLDAWFDALQLNNVTLVVHDWGSALGFHWANRHRDRIKGIVYMESFVKPVTWEDWPDFEVETFKSFRSEKGEKDMLGDNIFIEKLLPGEIMRELTEEEMNAYRAPFKEPGESRRPLLTWTREVPFEGYPSDTHKIFDEFSSWLSTSDTPKLFINVEPGIILIGKQREFCRNWPNQKEITIKGLHFIQEDTPNEIGQAIYDFTESLP